ncbi:MAG: hypothetical protein EAZ70_00910 [Runella slithyformis]|jgi:hypothetical protein|nr:MAG: hypothetical protein EAY79_08480 [Runella slithyformis]TAF29682.1 MAG: hypothetical protein EAZ70_00910 [Runella slithyformis]TAF48501.1 MAG: hypothetical protein EAZ63_04295 [Runella slithyformis]TAF83299.1 MAG: hypothetical protein EAZ50_01350 [Runella slithyformis]TAG73628.1 MAG: hypothetical protein EAZ26_03035 [Runella slithyformis]
MLDFPVPFMGTNATRQHQRIIAKMIWHLTSLYVAGKINYEAIPEVMLDDTNASPTPDVILTDNVLDRDVVIVEIMGKKAFKSDWQKVQILVEAYDIDEGFAYNYQDNKWRKYKRGVGEITENPSFCDSIGYDLNDFLK